MVMYRGDEPLPANPTEEDASEFLVHLLRRNVKLQQYGYEIFLRSAIEEFLFDVGRRPRNQQLPNFWIDQVSPAFLGAAWSLCRLGVLRPGVAQLNGQSTGEGQGYSLTSFGREWIKETDEPILIPSDTNRTSKMLLAFAAEFGDAYSARASDAARCFSAHAFLACCVMVGAAAEAIFLSAASEKLGEDKAVAMYKSGAGRGRLQTTLLGQQPEWLRNEFESHTSLVSYWRDQASHGHASPIGESEAFMALLGLLRFAHFVQDHWDELTGAK
jgi:hypothetical protein